EDVAELAGVAQRRERGAEAAPHLVQERRREVARIDAPLRAQLMPELALQIGRQAGGLDRMVRERRVRLHAEAEAPGRALDPGARVLRRRQRVVRRVDLDD